MKIGIVAQPFDRFPPLDGSSIAVWAHELSNRLVPSHEISIYCGTDSREVREDGERQGRVALHRVSKGFDDRMYNLARQMEWRFPEGLAGRDYLFWRYYYFTDRFYPRYVRSIGSLLNRHGIDVIIVSNFSQFVPGIRSQNPDAKIVLMMQCDWLVELDEKTVRSRLDHVDAICGCSNYIAEGVSRRFPGHAHKCHTVYNGCNLDRFQRSEERMAEAALLSRKLGLDGKKVILFSGRVCPEKGVHVLIEAMEKVLREEPDCALVVVGGLDGGQPPSPLWVFDKDPAFRNFHQLRRNYKEKLNDLAAAFGDRVILSGHVPHHDLGTYYSLTDVFVHPSLWSEPFGMVLTEAMACECPVVSTWTGGIPEVVADGETGTLVPVGNRGDLSNAIIAMLRDEEKRREMGRRGRQRVEECFTWNRSAEMLGEVIDGLHRG